MRLSLDALLNKPDNQDLALLPGLCCQAAGGNGLETNPITAAWLTCYAAARIMDSVEDRDEPDGWWAENGPARAISAATGLYFTANLALGRLDLTLDDPLRSYQIRDGMLNRFLEMSSGQHLDLSLPQPSLDQYWRIAQGKSGAFFEMACWAGARLASDQPEVLEGFRQYGRQVGLMIQMLDDLKDMQWLDEQKPGLDLKGLTRSLPVVFVLEVCTEMEREAFRGLLEKASPQPEDLSAITQIIESNGGGFYLLTELDLHRQLALDGLEQAQALPPARGLLEALVDHLYIPT